MRELFNDDEAAEHFEMIREAGMSFQQLLNGSTAEDHQPQQSVPNHLRASTVDETFKQPVRMHSVEGDRDVSQPFKARNPWRLEIGPDGRPQIVPGLNKPGMKLNWSDSDGVILTPTDEPTRLPNRKPAGYR